MKKALIITSNFPPAGMAGGTIRVTKFCKYLPQYGISPIIITKKISPYEFVDIELLKDLPRNLNVLRSSYFDFGNISKFIKRISNFFKKEKINNNLKQSPIGIGKYFYIPDGDIGWLLSGILSSRKAVKYFRPDILISSSPSLTAHLIAYFAKKITRLPWIADFRDPWINNPFAEPPTKIYLGINKQLEKKVVKTADKVVGISKTLINDMISRYPEFSKDKFKVISNGFDKEDFKQTASISKEEDILKSKFVITHLGALYGARSPKNFILGIAQLLEKEPEIAQNILIRLVGAIENQYINLIKKMNLSDIIQIIPQVSYKKGLNYIINSDYLLLMPGQGPSTITGKIFEYIAAQKPILALLNEDNIELKDFLQEMKLKHCYIADNQADDIRKALSFLYSNRENVKVDLSQYENFKEKYSRRNLTEELVKLINELTVDVAEKV